MIVAGIETVATGKVKPTGRLELNQHDLALEKGTELGRFYLGSTAVVLFEQNKITWDEQFKANSIVFFLAEFFNSILRNEEASVQIYNQFLELKDKGTTLIITSHYQEDIDQLCDKVYEMVDGELKNYDGKKN